MKDLTNPANEFASAVEVGFAPTLQAIVSVDDARHAKKGDYAKTLEAVRANAKAVGPAWEMLTKGSDLLDGIIKNSLEFVFGPPPAPRHYTGFIRRN